VDRRALPEPSPGAAAKTKRPPRNQAEDVLSGIFTEVLHLEEISVDDNLFELGADSIQIFQIVARANRAGLGVTVQEVLRHPTIESLSVASSSAQPATRQPALERILPAARERYRVRNN
jgi:aryl carrier-like protein